MKRWALFTVSLYAISMSILVTPILLLLAGRDDPGLLGFFYVWLAPVLILAQAVLLFAPVAVVQDRPVKRRKIVVSAVVGAIPMAAMTIVFFGSIILMMLGEKTSGDQLYSPPILLSALAVFWLVWGIIFWKSFHSTDPTSFTATVTRWLLRGSILEVLVAIPSHIISRHRDECCAPVFSLLGIATGLSVGLMSFGPGIFFLFAKRIKDKKGRTST